MKVYQVYLFFTVLLFTNNSFAQVIKGQEIEKIVAWVDNEIVLQSELQITAQQYKNQFGNQEAECAVLETMILNKLLIAKSKIDSVYVEEEQVDNELDRRIQQLFAQYGGDADKVLKEYGKTLDELKNELRPNLKEQLLIQKMQMKITDGVAVSPKEVRQFYNRLPKDSLPKFSTTVEIGQVIRYAKPSQEAKDAAASKLLDLKKQIESGADFAELAKKYSDDPGSARLGGELGYFNRGQLVPQYEAAALSMRPGEMSQIVESIFGFHLIQLIDRRGNEFNSRHILIKPETSYKDINREIELLDSIRNLILKDSISFTGAASKYNEDQELAQNNGYVTDYEGNFRIATDRLGTLYFTVEDMTPGEITQAEKFLDREGKNAARITYLKAKTPPHLANLTDDYQQLKDAALEEKRNEKTESWVKETRKEVYVNIGDEFGHCNILN